MAMVLDLPQPTKALEFTAFAVCLSRTAYTSGCPDDALIHESRKLYGLGLHALRRALADPKLVCNDEILVACLLLAMYEVFECPSKGRSGYLSHYDGCAKLIQMRGPHAHKEGFAHAAYCVFRVMGAFESMINRETFLSDDTWKTVPFSVIPKAPFDRIFDILLEAPAIMDQSDKLGKISAPCELFQATLAIVDRCWDLDRKLNGFYDDLRSSANGPLYWPVLSSRLEKVQEVDQQADEEEIFGAVEYRFIDLRLGSTLLFYWTICLMLHSGMCQLYGIIDQLRPAIYELRSRGAEGEKDAIDAMLADCRLPPLEHHKDFINFVRNICQSVAYCTQDDLGMSIVTAPLNIIVDTLTQWPQYEREREWAMGALERVQRRGLKIIYYSPRHDASPGSK